VTRDDLSTILLENLVYHFPRLPARAVNPEHAELAKENVDRGLWVRADASRTVAALATT
jgi:hypothetical protein